MGMESHVASPTVKHREHARSRTEPSRIGEKFLQCMCGAREEDSVEDLRLGSGERTELIGEREGDQVVGAGQQPGLLLELPIIL